MPKIEFGLFGWIDRSKAPLHQLYKERLEFLVAADQASFFCYHLAEHHATDMYRQTWERSQHDADRLNRHVGAPKLGVLRQVVVAETDDEALAITRNAHDCWYRSITKLWHDHDDHSVDGIFAWETATQHEIILSGSPRRVCDQLDRLVSTSDCNCVIRALPGATCRTRSPCVRFTYSPRKSCQRFARALPTGPVAIECRLKPSLSRGQCNPSGHHPLSAPAR